MPINDLFCGSADSYPITTFTPKSLPWDSNLLIGNLFRKDVELTDKVLENLKTTFWDNLCSEFDADNFCIFLKEEEFALSDDFKAFEYVWRRDEYNHYLGFRHFYSILYDIPVHDIIAKLNERVVDFNPIKNLLEDEFRICLLLAYDEIATTKSYALDYDFYNSLGHQNFLKWIKLVTRDEAYHFNNCMELIGKNHYHRISEIPKLVDQYIEWDINRTVYQGTFVLDHANYSEGFLISSGTIMKKYFK
jgi:hypothetical protein